MTSPPVPLSLEVVRHHVDLHPCHAGAEEFTCPCDDTILLACPVCAEVLTFAVRHGTWCEHAEALRELFE